MKRTRPSSLIGLGILGLAIGFLIETFATGNGSATLIPPYSLPLTLFVIAAFVVALAIPIRQATHGKQRARIDPFRAARIAMLAKACSLAGALLVGFGAGVVIFFLTRSVVPGGSAILQSVVSFFGAVALLVGGLVAEFLCTLPPGPDDQTEGHHG